MSSLPLISHHLFVAALGNEGCAQEKRAGDQAPRIEVTDESKVIPLELIDFGEPMTAEATRLLRTSAAAWGT